MREVFEVGGTVEGKRIGRKGGGEEWEERVLDLRYGCKMRKFKWNIIWLAG